MSVSVVDSEIRKKLLDATKQIEDAQLPKPKSSSTLFTRLAQHAGMYPVPNLAVTICDGYFEKAVKQAMEESKSEDLIRLAGKLSYCAAMPNLAGADNIRDYIACVAHGMAMGIIPGPEGTRLLYAAQVARIAHTKGPKKRRKTPQKQTGQAPANQEESTAWNENSTEK